MHKVNNISFRYHSLEDRISLILKREDEVCGYLLLTRRLCLVLCHDIADCIEGITSNVDCESGNNLRKEFFEISKSRFDSNSNGGKLEQKKIDANYDLCTKISIYGKKNFQLRFFSRNTEKIYFLPVNRYFLLKILAMVIQLSTRAGWNISINKVWAAIK